MYLFIYLGVMMVERFDVSAGSSCSHI